MDQRLQEVPMTLPSVIRRSSFRAAIPAVVLLARAAGAQEQPAPAFRLSGFADAIVSRSTRSDSTDLDFGELDPYATARFSDSWTALGEVLVRSEERRVGKE